MLVLLADRGGIWGGGEDDLFSFSVCFVLVFGF